MDFEPQKQHENMDVFDMIKHLKTLYQEQARHERFDWELAIDLILQSLSENFSHFVMNLLMNEIDKFLPQHVSMLRTVERNMNKGKEKTIITVNNGKFKKKLRKRNKFKGNGKGKVVSKPSIKSLNHVERMENFKKRNDKEAPTQVSVVVNEEDEEEEEEVPFIKRQRTF
uniref:Uncharacterized protein n=1 Tax=Medicago truncatula TaxID=3880 RepID=A2Q2N7_MEDTR|nr:hypothetical protein MtrDRAFT_AC151521g46v2 [Medicago truncatula]